MKEQLTFLQKLTAILSIVCGAILYITYFYTYLESGSYAYGYRIFILFGLIFLLLYFVFTLCTHFFKEKNIINLVLGIIGIILCIYTFYLYFTTNPKYLFDINNTNLIYQITLLIMVFSNRKKTLSYLIGLIGLLVFLTVESLELFNNQYTYDINISALFVIELCYVLIISKKAQDISKRIGIILSSCLLLVAGIYGRIHFVTMDDYNITIFMVVLATLFILSSLIISLKLPKNKNDFVHIIIQTTGIITIIVVICALKNISIIKPNDVAKMNPYRILIVIPLALYIIDTLFDYLKKSNVLLIINISLTIISCLTCSILLFINLEALYHIFYTYYIILCASLFILLITSMILEQKALQKKNMQ